MRRLLAAVLFACVASPLRSHEAEAPSAGVVAGGAVPLSMIEQAAADRLRRLRNEEYDALRQALEEVFFKVATEREAAERGLSVPDLLAAEGIAPPSEQEKRDFYEKNRGRVGGQPYEKIAPEIESYLFRETTAPRRAAYLRPLKAKYGARALLQPPRAPVDASDDPSVGPADAPVQLVIFSDFQCPYCARAVDVVKRLEALYGKSLRVVFRDFPLAMHDRAPRAAEAAACAHEKGKFWAYHDLLFANPEKLSEEGLSELAVRAGLKKKAFEACLASGRQAEEWKKDAADGRSYGVTGTPTFFVNGRYLFGNQTFESFVQAIDDELLARGLPPPMREEGK